MRVTMKPGSTMRVARPTDNLAAIAEMYAKGLGFAVLAEFKDHRGFDGVILGHPRQRHHIEFTSQRGTPSRQSSDPGSSADLLRSQ